LNNDVWKNVKKYSIIYADPPWYFNKRANVGKFGGGSYMKYPLMKEGEIIEMSPFIQHITAKNCALFMWTTSYHHKSAYKVMEHWGFEPINYGFVWMKINKGDGKPRFGTGFYTKSNIEICLFGRKGKMTPITNSIGEMIIEPIREHSRKPDIVREKIVDLFGDLPRIELFARQRTEGWDTWGKEICDKELNNE